MYPFTVITFLVGFAIAISEAGSRSKRSFDDDSSEEDFFPGNPGPPFPFRPGFRRRNHGFPFEDPGDFGGPDMGFGPRGVYARAPGAFASAGGRMGAQAFANPMGRMGGPGFRRRAGALPGNRNLGGFNKRPKRKHGRKPAESSPTNLHPPPFPSPVDHFAGGPLPPGAGPLPPFQPGLPFPPMPIGLPPLGPGFPPPQMPPGLPDPVSALFSHMGSSPAPGMHVYSAPGVFNFEDSIPVGNGFIKEKVALFGDYIPPVPPPGFPPVFPPAATAVTPTEESDSTPAVETTASPSEPSTAS